MVQKSFTMWPSTNSSTTSMVSLLTAVNNCFILLFWFWCPDVRRALRLLELQSQHRGDAILCATLHARTRKPFETAIGSPLFMRARAHHQTHFFQLADPTFARGLRWGDTQTLGAPYSQNTCVSSLLSRCAARSSYGSNS
jgi:hypothetical protein